jgi:hypothetical protein
MEVLTLWTPGVIMMVVTGAEIVEDVTEVEGTVAEAATSFDAKKKARLAAGLR